MDPNDKLEEARRHLRMIDALNGRDAAQLGIMKSQGGGDTVGQSSHALEISSGRLPADARRFVDHWIIFGVGYFVSTSSGN